MKIDFIVGYKLNGKSGSNGRTAEICISLPDVSKQANKEEFLLQFCGQIAQALKGCIFYKDVQVMAPFSERPIRIKYVIRFPNDSCAVLEALTNPLDLKEKAKELKDHFDTARRNNTTKLKLEYPVLLTAIKNDYSNVERDYGVMVLESTNAINFFKQIGTNGQSN